MMTVFNPSDGIWNRFEAFPAEGKHILSIQVVFRIDIKYFLLNENTFEALKFILSVFY